MTAIIGQRGRYFEIRWAERPVVVITITALAIALTDASTAAIAVVCVESVGCATCKVKGDPKHHKKQKRWVLIPELMVPVKCKLPC